MDGLNLEKTEPVCLQTDVYTGQFNNITLYLSFPMMAKTTEVRSNL